LLREELKADTRIKQHIDNCLLCRQCERVCPSGVQFGYFMDGLRQHLHNDHDSEAEQLGGWLENNARGKRLNHWLRLAHVSGIQKIAGLLPGKPGRLARSLPTISGISAQQHHYPARVSGQQVRLFKGCTQTVFGSALFDTSIRVLNRLGVSVNVPPQQGCCGALSQHSGNARRASVLAANNLDAFNTEPALPIITLASGCAASLKDYANHADEYPGAEQFTQLVMDISHYLLSLDWPTDINVQPLDKRVVVHSPCSLRNVLRQDKAVATLLGRIPAAEILPLGTTNSCCGAAGSYMFEDKHVHLSDTLANETAEQIRRLEADLVVTSNIGCAMQLQAGLKRAGLRIEVLHPVELLAQQLGLD
jgi:glycolate oxidase iron-sulfur subunit